MKATSTIRYMTRATQITTDVLAYAKSMRESFGLQTFVDAESMELLIADPNAFLFGLIADQSVRVETAWSLPLRLMRRLGHLDVDRIAQLPVGALATIIRSRPALHRYPNQLAKYLTSASALLVAKYNGSASLIWAPSVNAKNIVLRLEEFDGIGHKKASLGVMLLVRDMGLTVTDTATIDIAYDMHIRRVFFRAGLSKQDTPANVLTAARTMLPSYPGALTTPFWLIGRNWCHPSKPNCAECPIRAACAKKVARMRRKSVRSPRLAA